jgi:hypothetical protein
MDFERAMLGGALDADVSACCVLERVIDIGGLNFQGTLGFCGEVVLICKRK